MRQPNIQHLTRMLCLILALAGVVAGCGGGGGSSPTEVIRRPVTFEYRALTRIDPNVDFSTCTDKQVIFTVHLHFTWNNWEDRRSMRAVGTDLWTYSDQVPAERELRVALHDPNSCLEGSPYVAPENLYVNGVLLDRVVGVGEGVGLGFTVRSDGSVEP